MVACPIMLAAGQAVGGDSLDTRLAAPPAPTVVSAFLLRSHRREGVGRVGRAGSNGATALTPSYSHYLALSPSLPLPSITCIISVLNQLATFRIWLLVKFSLSIILMHSSRVLVAVCVCLLCLCVCVCTISPSRFFKVAPYVPSLKLLHIYTLWPSETT